MQHNYMQPKEVYFKNYSQSTIISHCLWWLKPKTLAKSLVDKVRFHPHFSKKRKNDGLKLQSTELMIVNELLNLLQSR